MSVNGILNVLKPAGRTSFEVVGLVRRLSGERRVGHAGTLDPEATGVLPIGLGQGTRVMEFLAQGRKTYRAQIELGVTTDTYDASGRVLARGDASSLTKEQVGKALSLFRGPIEQTPPMYSALKHHGQPLYRLARARIEVARGKRKTEIFCLELVDWSHPVVTVEVECAKGTYIRSLAHDLGQVLGCGAHLKSLVRLKSGIFDIRDSVTISELEHAFEHGDWQELLYPIDVALLHLMAAIVGEENERALCNGRPLPLGRGDNGQWCRAYSLDGHIIALLRFEPQQALWRPKKVFSAKLAPEGIDI